jgi:hypothetical protein
VNRHVRVLLADLLVVVVVVDYAVYLVLGRAWLLTGPRSVAGLGLALALVAAAVALPLVPLRAVAPLVAAGTTLAVGVAGLVWGDVPVLGAALAAAFVAGVVATWLAVVLAVRAGTTPGTTPGTADRAARDVRP